MERRYQHDQSSGKRVALRETQSTHGQLMKRTLALFLPKTPLELRHTDTAMGATEPGTAPSLASARLMDVCVDLIRFVCLIVADSV